MKALLALSLTAVAGLSMATNVEINGTPYEVVKPKSQLVFESFTTFAGAPIQVGDSIARADVSLASPLAQPGRVTGYVIVKLAEGSNAGLIAEALGAQVVHSFATTAMLSFAEGTVLADNLDALSGIEAVQSFSIDINTQLIEKQ